MLEEATASQTKVSTLAEILEKPAAGEDVKLPVGCRSSAWGGPSGSGVFSSRPHEGGRVLVGQRVPLCKVAWSSSLVDVQQSLIDDPVRYTVPE